MKDEQTLIVIKHDGVARGITGEVIRRFERVGFKLVALEFIQSTEDLGSSHYPTSDKWFSTVGDRTLKDYKVRGIDAMKEFDTIDPIEIGKKIKGWLVEYLAYGPVLALVWEGPDAVKVGRKLVGDTVPANALPGTIRGDFSADTIELANAYGRPLYNIIHASGEVAEAKEEIELWFDQKEVFAYKLYATQVMGVEGKLH